MAEKPDVENISIALVLGMDQNGITKEMKTIRQQQTLEEKEQDSRALQNRKPQAFPFSWSSTLIQWRETRAMQGKTVPFMCI